MLQPRRQLAIFHLGWLVHRKRPPQVSRIHCFPHSLPKFLWLMGPFLGCQPKWKIGSGNLFARNELPSSKTAVKWYFLYDDMALAADCSDSYVLIVNLRFRKFARNLLARNDGRVSKTENWGEIAILEVGARPFGMVLGGRLVCVCHGCVCVCFFAVCLCRSLKFCVYLCLLLLRIWHSISISFLLIIWIIFNEAFTYNVFGTTYKRVTCSSTLSGHPSSSSSVNVYKSVGACRICFLPFWGYWNWIYFHQANPQPKSHRSSLTSRDWRQATARAPPRYTRSAYRGNVAPLRSPA